MSHPVSAAYPLDNSAIIHLAVNSKRTTNSFRLSLTLRDPIDVKIMQEALDAVCPRFPTIAAGIREGFFRHRVVPVGSTIRVQEDTGLLKGMDAQEIRRCGTRVICRGNMICVEMFHSLTDGYGGWHFLKSMVGEYLNRVYGIDSGCAGDLITPDTGVEEAEVEDSFLTHAGDRKAAMTHSPSFQIRPQETDTTVHNTTVVLPVAPLLGTARAHKGTITTLLTAVLAVSVMELQKKRTKKLLPVNVMVPVDLRKRFSSRTLRNFSLYALPQLAPGEEGLPLEHLTGKIRAQLEKQLSREQLQGMMTTNAAMQSHWLLSRLPLIVKCAGIRLGYHFFGSGNSSISLSNLGELAMPEAMRPYVLRADCLLTPRINGTYNCGVISYGGKLYINFTRNCAQPELERIFVRRLTQLGLHPVVELDGRETEDLEQLA